ncbi:MAG: hypothetical protein IPL22_11245 [Bacteroidetes bacterium]|nr:hypothetical protein [Bacteroidota bacterium]
MTYDKTPLQVAMNATFHNQWNHEFGCSDSNSVIQITNFKASWQRYSFYFGINTNYRLNSSRCNG